MEYFWGATSNKKIYHDGSRDEYSYHEGLLHQKKNAKNQITSFVYDVNGNVTKIDYPNMTDVEIAYNSLDKPVQMVDGIGTHQFAYDVMGRLTAVDGPWTNDTVEYSYNDLGQRAGLSVQRDATTADELAYSYDALNRLQGITGNAGTFVYSYVGNTGMIAQLTNPNGTKAQYSYDALQRLTEIHNKTATNGNVSKYAYGYNNRDVRTYVEQTVGSDPMQRVDFGYDSTDQLISEVSAETPVPDLNRTYAYDAMGNRTGTQSVTTADTITNTYSANKLNQYTQIAAVWDGGNGTSTANLTYDVSGNLTQMATTGTNGGSTSQYTFDDADRLIEVIRKDGAGVNEHKSEYSYDGLSRLCVSKEYTWDNNAWVLQNTKGRIYDGMNVVQERDGTNAVTVFYTRGNHMGGGIGGLLARSTTAGHFYYHYDGRGNIVQMTDDAQETVANYRYSAFGTLLASTGTEAYNNPYRFSTKEYHNQTGLYDYGYRFYSPGLGRWINRDPIKETGGLNVYEFVTNNPLARIDKNGHIGVPGAVIGAGLGGLVGGLSAGFNGDNVAVGVIAGIVGGVVGGFFVNPVIGGAVAGALQQLILEWNDECDGIDWQSVGISAVIGAVLGLVAGVVKGLLPSSAGSLDELTNGIGRDGLDLKIVTPELADATDDLVHALYEALSSVIISDAQSFMKPNGCGGGT